MVGGMETALLLWEICCVPSLLYGFGTWTGISKTTEKQLNQKLNCFLRLVLQPGASLAALSWDFSMLEMSLRVKIEKVMLVLYLRNLENTTLSRRVYEE